MARLQLDIPEHLPFQTEISIRVTDMNYANHLANDKVLTLMHEARALYFLDMGMTEANAEGTSFIVADAAIIFKAEGFFPQKIIVEAGPGDYSRVGFDFYYRFSFKDSGKIMAIGKTGMVCFDFTNRKIQSVPPKLKERMGDAWEVQA